MSKHHGRIGGSTRQRRNAKILKASDICGICGKAGADAVDHKIPLARGGTEDPNNLQPVHHNIAPYCNRRKADLLPSEYDRKVILICGPPGAGKTTLAHELAESGALDVYDLDDDQWAGSDALFRAALVRIREQPTARAVVIRTGATVSARQKSATACGATECIVLDTPLRICLTRIEERNRDHPPLAVQAKGARDWWTKYEPGPVKLSFSSLRLQRSGSLE